MPIEPEQFLEKYNQLPQDVQEIMIDFQSAQVIYETAQEQGLLQAVSRIAEITSDVMMGFVPITKFKQTIQSELNVEEGKARIIAQVIRDKIFLKIVDSLRKIHNLQ